MPKNPIIERIRAEAPPIRLLPLRRRFLGRVATELAGSRAAGLPLDDANQPPRWTNAPANTLRGLEHVARTRRPIDLVAAAQRAAEAFGRMPSQFGHDQERWQNTALELKQLEDLMRVDNQGENNG